MQNKKQTRELTYAQALREATQQSMEKDPEVILIGEGVPDVKSIFGTTAGLMENFGNKRVFDMPLSENGLTGICIGAAISGMRPIMVHQRIDFTLLALDQLINNAAKWHYLFNGQKSVPLVVRMIIGRGWGQGAQHSQSLQALFAHIPGLKVVMPSMPYDAKGMLISAIEDNNPVIFIEHRWLFHIKGHVPEEPYRVPLDKSKTIREGKHVTIAAISYMVIEALHVADYLEKYGIYVTVISVHALNPLDVKPVLKSVQKTGYLVVLDTACKTNGISAEITSHVVERAWSILKKPPLRIASPDHPVPTTKYLADEYYPEANLIAVEIVKLLGLEQTVDLATVEKELRRPEPRDLPDMGLMPF